MTHKTKKIIALTCSILWIPAIILFVILLMRVEYFAMFVFGLTVFGVFASYSYLLYKSIVNLLP